MTIAEQIWGQICVLSDPDTIWVRGTPNDVGESCAVFYKYRMFMTFSVSRETRYFLNDFTSDYSATDGRNYISIVRFNDHIAESVDEVIWLLEEAYNLAEEEGL
jgi:hypothetical protein